LAALIAAVAAAISLLARREVRECRRNETIMCAPSNHSGIGQPVRRREDLRRVRAKAFLLEHDPEKWTSGFPKRSCSNCKSSLYFLHNPVK
jgi:hypothetical protein